MSSRPQSAPAAVTGDRRLVRDRIRIRVPQSYQSDPVISELVSRFGLIVNITAALLGQDGHGDGWFDLDVQGTHDQINQSLDYLNDLGIDSWRGEAHEGW